MKKKNKCSECGATNVYDDICEDCCDHSDCDDHCCLICGKDMAETRACRAYDQWKDRMKYGGLT